MPDLTEDQKLNAQLTKQLEKQKADNEGLAAQLLTAQNAATEARKQLNTLTATQESLQKQLTASQESASSLDGQLKAALLGKATAESELEQAVTVVTELKTKLAEKEADNTKLSSVKVGKDVYELLTDFFYKGQEVTIQTLIETPALAEELVKEGVGTLRKVVQKK